MLVVPTDRYTYVEALHGSERLVREAMGISSDAGLDCHTANGQLLRRMTAAALVVPSSALQAGLRVPQRVRGLLCVTVYRCGMT